LKEKIGFRALFKSTFFENSTSNFGFCINFQIGTHHSFSRL